MKKLPPHPMQPMVIDDNDVVRFRKNAIVEYLLDAGPFDMNKLAVMPFSREDREQFAQLIGYSWGGFTELSYVSPETAGVADSMAATALRAAKRKKARS